MSKKSVSSGDRGPIKQITTSSHPLPNTGIWFLEDTVFQKLNNH